MEYFNESKQKQLLAGLSGPLRFIASYNALVDDLNNLGRKYAIDISKCVIVGSGIHGPAFRITQFVNQLGPHCKNLVTEIFSTTHKHGLFPLEFVFVETEPEVAYKFLNDRVFKQGDSISVGARIFQVSLNKVPLRMPYYETLDDLRNFDPEFIEFRKKNPQFAETICKQEHIVQAKDFVIVKAEGDVNSLNGLLLMHSISGNRGRKYFTGVHHVELPIPFYLKGFTVIEPPDSNGVYTATFKIQKENGKIIEKKEISTMFPTHWSIQQFYFECYHALETKIKVEGSPTLFRSTTHSGVPVEMHFSTQGRFRTIYPMYTGKLKSN